MSIKQNTSPTAVKTTRSKLDYESDLMEQALASAKNRGDVDSSKQRIYNEVKKGLDKAYSSKSNPHNVAKNGFADISSLTWDIGFTPKNFKNLVSLSGASSNIDFYTKYGISKTVFYSYMRGETSPSYKDWQSLVLKILKSTNKTEISLCVKGEAKPESEAIEVSDAH